MVSRFRTVISGGLAFGDVLLVPALDEWNQFERRWSSARAAAVAAVSGLIGRTGIMAVISRSRRSVRSAAESAADLER